MIPSHEKMPTFTFAPPMPSGLPYLRSIGNSTMGGEVDAVNTGRGAVLGILFGGVLGGASFFVTFQLLRFFWLQRCRGRRD